MNFFSALFRVELFKKHPPPENGPSLVLDITRQLQNINIIHQALLRVIYVFWLLLYAWYLSKMLFALHDNYWIFALLKSSVCCLVSENVYIIM